MYKPIKKCLGTNISPAKAYSQRFTVTFNIDTAINIKINVLRCNILYQEISRLFIALPTHSRPFIALPPLAPHCTIPLLSSDSSLLFPGIEDLCNKRDELQKQIHVEEEEKCKIQNDLRILTERLARINESLAKKIASRNEYDKTIAETEAAYMKVMRRITCLNPFNASSGASALPLTIKIGLDE